MEVNLDNIPEQLYSIYYECMHVSQHFSEIPTMCDQIQCHIIMVLNESKLLGRKIFLTHCYLQNSVTNR